MTNQYWQHKTSGDQYAVQVENGAVVSACGPLYYKEATEANLSPWNFDNDPALVDDLNAHKDEYQVGRAEELGVYDLAQAKQDMDLQRTLWTASGRQSFKEYRAWLAGNDFHAAANLTAAQVRAEAERTAPQLGLTTNDEHKVQLEAFIDGFIAQFEEEHEDK